MEKIIVIALLVVNVQLVVASCSSETANACLDAYTACSVAAANTTEAACTCYGFYLRCLLDTACITDSEYQTIVQTCTDSGCTRQQCLGGIDVPVTAPVSAPVAAPVTFTPVPSSGCDYDVADACLTTYLSCVGSGSQEEICNCYGPYIYCYYYGAGCLTQGQYEEAVQYCVQFNCSVQQCNSAVSGPISSTPVQAPVQAPVQSPFPDAPVSSCDYNTIFPCQERFVNCTNAAMSSSQMCACNGPYYNCVYDTGCITSSEYWNAVNYCRQTGCTIEQCTANSTVVPPPVETPVTAPYATPYSEPIDNSTCAQSDIMTCYNSYEACVNTSSTWCGCFGSYLYCLNVIQCFNSTEYEQNIDLCVQNGCSYQQCTNTGVTPIQAPSVQAPIPIEAPSSSQCNTELANFCANEYTSCVVSAGTNTSDICSCYGPYFVCLYAVDCLTYSQYESLIQTCAQSGCTLQQCGGIVSIPVTTPFEAPTASTPIGPTPTSTSPISAPFSAPSTVICLQPWELVLIVVGSVLAGVGIAAIIGVIIYLSRGRSGVKKTNKYAKLQRY